jgi:hypothetical protein
MNQQENIRRILREMVNESTFFRRRVDMRLMEKEFFENLNIITDVYLRKYIDGINFNFETFENHVIDYFMDGYYNELTNDGENDYPHDEVYEFLSNHFHDKIKERYDLMFKSNINESVPPQVRRRNEYFDIFFTGKRKNIIYCSFGTPDHLMDWILELTLEDLYHAWFYETVSDEEWEKSIPYIENYLKEKYYEETRQIWMSKCEGKLYESEDKKSRFLSTIEEDGLFQVMQDTGLSLPQIYTKTGELPREVLEKYVKDFIKNDGDQFGSGSDEDTGLMLGMEISSKKEIESFYLSKGVVTVEVNEFDSNGRKVAGSYERLSNLSDEEIFIIVDELSQLNDDYLDYM